MNITYLARYGSQGPSSRYRIFQYLPHFARAGVNVRIEPLFDNSYFDILSESPTPARLLRRWRYAASRYAARQRMLRNHQDSGVVIEHQLFPFLPVWLEQRSLPDRYLLEFDDAIHRKHPRKMPFLLSHASGVIAGNDYLAEYARRYNRNVHVVPSVIDTDLYRPSLKKPGSKVRIGWCGLQYNFKYLVMLAPVFRELLRRYDVEISVLSGSSPADPGFPFTFEKWDSENEVKQIAGFDIGVMPLQMDDWCRGKCGMKLLQFMALGIPPVATPVGVNSQIIEPAVSGFLAASEAEWIDQLSRLIEDPALRQTVGKAAAERISNQYSIQSWFPKLLSIYEKYFA